MKSNNLQEYISATRIRLRKTSPFFAALSLYAEIEFTTKVQLAATNGKKIFFNPNTYIKLPPSERDGVYLHELLHMALIHNLRRGTREHKIFNIAADIVVNGMIVNEGDCNIPKFGITDPELEDLSVEEIYEILIKNKNEYEDYFMDLINDDMKNEKNEDIDNKDLEGNGIDDNYETGLSDLKTESDIRAYWRQAINDSRLITKVTGKNEFNKSFDRNLGEILEPEIDWKNKLWNFLVKTPTDFGGFDRRLIHTGLYLENLEGESIDVYVCVDTSGSVSDIEINKFMGEIKGILNSYPNLICKLWYADHMCYGPYEIESIKEIPKPIGGGGTNFEPFFNAINSKDFKDKEAVCVYLTDGYGYFPSTRPKFPVLWVVIPGGAENDYFPFGDVIRLNN